MSSLVFFLLHIFQTWEVKNPATWECQKAQDKKELQQNLPFLDKGTGKEQPSKTDIWDNTALLQWNSTGNSMTLTSTYASKSWMESLYFHLPEPLMNFSTLLLECFQRIPRTETWLSCPITSNKVLFPLWYQWRPCGELGLLDPSGYNVLPFTPTFGVASGEA